MYTGSTQITVENVKQLFSSSVNLLLKYVCLCYVTQFYSLLETFIENSILYIEICYVQR